MNFTPKTEDEIVKSGLLEKGEYPFTVLEAKNKVSQKGNDMIEIKLSVIDNQGREHFLYDYLMEKFLFKLKHFCDAAKLQDKYNAGTLEDHDCVGRSGICKVYIQEDKSGQYQPKNAIADYLVGEIKSQPTQTAQFDDDIPF